jgi:hypothetical protein
MFFHKRIERCFGVLLLQKQNFTRILLAIVNEGFFNKTSGLFEVQRSLGGIVFGMVVAVASDDRKLAKGKCRKHRNSNKRRQTTNW